MVVDLIVTGPWKVQVRGKPNKFNALTCIDTVTNLVEIGRIDHKPLQHVTGKFAQSWMEKYPWPNDVSTITTENSQDGNSKSYLKSVT